uniref:Uncharacterized protein n=1 Tax=Acinetobacter phage P919 TaxID=3229763 RepID=A0AB39AJ20_9CAUD
MEEPILVLEIEEIYAHRGVFFYHKNFWLLIHMLIIKFIY